VDRGRSGSLGSRADRVLVAVEEDLPVRMLALELGDLGEDVFEGRRFVIRIDPYVNGLFRSVVRTSRCDHGVPRERDVWGGL
jgi:hypothetical protein